MHDIYDGEEWFDAFGNKERAQKIVDALNLRDKRAVMNQNKFTFTKNDDDGYWDIFEDRNFLTEVNTREKAQKIVDALNMVHDPQFETPTPPQSGFDEMQAVIMKMIQNHVPEKVTRLERVVCALTKEYETVLEIGDDGQSRQLARHVVVLAGMICEEMSKYSGQELNVHPNLHHKGDQPKQGEQS